MQNVIKQLKKLNPDLKEAEIEGILYIVLNTPGLTNTDLIRLTGIPKETLRRFKRAFSKYLNKTEGDLVSLNSKGEEALKKMDPKPYRWRLVEYENKDLEGKIDELRSEFIMKPKRELDQFFSTSRTSVSKARVIGDRGVISGKNIGLIGDDDLVSASLCLLDTSFNKLFVFDVDGDVLSAVRGISNKLGINNVHTVSYDVRNEFEGRYPGTFDVVMIDPPYTKSGVSLFLNRAVQLIRRPDLGSGYIFLCYGSSFKSSENFLAIQDIIQQYNLVIEDKIDKFNRYKGAESIGSASSLYILRTTKKTKALNNYTLSNIYTFEAAKSEKFPYIEHYTFKLFGVSPSVLRSEKRLVGMANELCNKHRLKVEDTIVTRFKPGYTITLVLKDSNLILHTWVEKKALHMDLITCSPIHESENLLNTVRNLFRADFVEMKRIE